MKSQVHSGPASKSFKNLSNFNHLRQDMIRAALSELEQKTCFRFPTKTEQHTDYVMFERGDGCYSDIGRKGKNLYTTLKHKLTSRRKTDTFVDWSHLSTRWGIDFADRFIKLVIGDPYKITYI